MWTQIVGLVVSVLGGVISGLILVKIQAGRDDVSRPPEVAQHPEPARGATQRRQSDVTATSAVSRDTGDPWLAGGVSLVAVLGLGLVYVSGAPLVGSLIILVTSGLLAGLLLADLIARARHHRGGVVEAQIMARAVVASGSAVTSTIWASRVRYPGLSLRQIHDAVVRTPFSDRPKLITDEFHSAGWKLISCVALGAIVVVISVLVTWVDVIASVCAQRVRSGRAGGPGRWLARHYRVAHGSSWLIVVVLGVLGLLLSSALALRLVDAGSHVPTHSSTGPTHAGASSN